MEGMFEVIKVEFEQNNKVQTKYTLDVSYDLFCEDYFHLRAYKHTFNARSHYTQTAVRGHVTSLRCHGGDSRAMLRLHVTS